MTPRRKWGGDRLLTPRVGWDGLVAGDGITNFGAGERRLLAYGGIFDGRRRILSSASQGRAASPPRRIGSAEDRPGAGQAGRRATTDTGCRETHGLSRGHGQY